MLRDCARDSDRGAPPQTGNCFTEHRRSGCDPRSRLSGKRNRDALPDRGTAAGDEHVRIDHLGVIRRVVFRDDLFRALSGTGIFARRAARDADRPATCPSNADRDAVKHRSAGTGIAR